MLEPLNFKDPICFGDPEESLQIEMEEQEHEIPGLVDTSAIDPLNVAFIHDTSSFQDCQSRHGLSIAAILNKEIIMGRAVKSLPESKHK